MGLEQGQEQGAVDRSQRRKRADHRAREQQCGQETGFRSLANKSITNNRSGGG